MQVLMLCNVVFPALPPPSLPLYFTESIFDKVTIHFLGYFTRNANHTINLIHKI